jgi:hypothetical protein
MLLQAATAATTTNELVTASKAAKARMACIQSRLGAGRELDDGDAC